MVGVRRPNRFIVLPGGPRALVAGADTVMMGSLFAGTADPGTVALALALPVAMTGILAPLSLVIYRRR